MNMIQKFVLFINTFFQNSDINFTNPLSSQELQSFLNFFMSTPSSPFHSHNGIICKSPNMKYILSYTRNYLIFKDDTIVDGTLDIPVYYCENCGHYHACLPYLFILPYSQYSIPFILCVLYDKYYSTLTVNEIIDKYHISVSTLYRWMDRYKRYLTYYRQLRNKYQNEFLKTLINSYKELLDDIFDISAHALFQIDRRLFNTTGLLKTAP